MLIKVNPCLQPLGWIALGLIFTPTVFGQMINWTSRYAPNFVEIREVTFGQGLYVAVGDESTVIHSSDGINWQNGNLPPGLSCNLKTVAYAFGQFYAGGVNLNTNQGVLLASIDGIAWADVTYEFLSTADSASGNFASLVSGSIGGMEYLAAVVKRPNDYGDAIAVTPNGSIWRDSGYGSRFHHFSINREGAIYVLSSNSSGYWTWLQLGVDSYGDPDFSGFMGTTFRFSTQLRHYAYGNATYVGADSARKLAYASSSSSLAFTYATSPLIADYTGVAFGRDTFVAVGSNGAVVASYDLGRKWNAVTNLGLQQITLNGVRYVGGKFIVYGGGRIVTGTPINKRSWETANLPSGAKSITSIASNGQRIVAVGKGGQILYSSTGANWSKALPATSKDLYKVVYDSPTKSFYATGAYGTLLRSSNGVRWFAVKTSKSGYYEGVARAGRFLLTAGGARGEFLQSSDGKSWSPVKESQINFAGKILGDGSAAYVFGPSRKFLVKRGNSKNWTVTRGPATTISTLTMVDKTIYAAAGNGRLLTTSRAKPGTWRSFDTKTSRPLLGIATNSAAAKQIAAVGEGGLVYSEPGKGRWRLEMIGGGKPVLNDVLRFKNKWIVAGASGNSAFIGHTDEH